MKDKIKRMIEKSKERKRISDHDEEGRIICDPNPLKYPAGLRKPPTREAQLQRILQAHQEQMAMKPQYVDETDFNIDEPDFLTPYERNAHVYDFEPEVPVPVLPEAAPAAPSPKTEEKGQ